MTLDKDYAGILASALCLIHCLAGPILIVFGYASIGLPVFLDEKFHIILLIPIILFALWSIPNGYKKHKNNTPYKLAIAGMVLLISGLFIENLEEYLTFFGSFSLMLSHFYNRKALNK